MLIKVTGPKTKQRFLQYESKLLKYLTGSKGIPEFIDYFVIDNFSFLVFERLGVSLKEHFKNCGGKFTPVTTILCAQQMLERIEQLHSKEFMLRDVKPAVFMTGVEKNENMICLMDFECAKRYIDRRTKTHIPYTEGKRVIGARRYCSILSGMGVEGSRRDDIESLGYVLVYFVKGSLPWQGLRKSKRRNTYDKKFKITTAELTEDLHKCFFKFVEYSKLLRFEDKPNYTYLQLLFSDSLNNEFKDDEKMFQWNIQPSTLPEKITALSKNKFISDLV